MSFRQQLQQHVSSFLQNKTQDEISSVRSKEKSTSSVEVKVH